MGSEERNSKRSRKKHVLWVGLMVGLPLGLGAYTLKYGEGHSYFSKDPAACANCHIMEPQYDSWQKSSHHTVATCVDCHLPHDFVGKYLAKADNGWHHSKGFTMQDFHEPIMIKPKNLEVLQKNCRECHGDFVHGTLDVAAPNKEPLNCIHCHRGVGHGLPAGIGGPWREEEASILNERNHP